uniref:Myosin motor domain-containing protein n=1 Tax=Meloidogyne floridensis TaxID=298350 RepID=A0A915NVE5_9BILA
MLEIEAVSELLGLSHSSHLVDALTQPSIKVGDVFIKRSQPLRKTQASAQALAKCLYERVFNWILTKCNKAIGINNNEENENNKGMKNNKFIGVLDMAGFEIMERNSFEQLCRMSYILEAEIPLGILSLLQEECIVPNGSELSLLEKMFQRLSHTAPSVFSKAKQTSRTLNSGHFTICHYAGSVIYNVDGWLEKNRDSVDSNILQVLANSQHPLISQLFTNSQLIYSKRKGPAMAQASISFVYREQLNKLLETIKQTRAHFIRCIVPNHQRIPFQLNGPLAMHQLSQEYQQKKLLNEDPRILVGNLCEDLELDEKRFQIGRTRLFCRVGLLSELESRRRNKLSQTLTDLQAYIRWYWAQIKLKRRRDEWESLLTIQQSLRYYIQLKSWPWYRLYQKVFQLIPLVLDKRRLNELLAENNELNRKLEESNEKLHKAKRDVSEFSERLEKSEKSREDERSKTQELRSELHLNEELLERMERKWDEQHLKVMRLNNTLGEQTKAIERLEEERNGLNKENEMLKENYRLECLERLSVEQSLNSSQEESSKLRSEATEMLTEISRLRSEINLRDEQIHEQKELINENLIQIGDLNNSIFEANEKLNELQPLLHSEKLARRRADNLADDLSQELNKMGEELDKVNGKRDAMV